MVLILDPKITEVINIRTNGKILTEIKKSNFLSLKFILNLILFNNSQTKNKNGISIVICFNIKIIGYLICPKKPISSKPILLNP